MAVSGLAMLAVRLLRAVGDAGQLFVDQAGFSVVNIIAMVEEVVTAGGSAAKSWFEACVQVPPFLAGAFLPI